MSNVKCLVCSAQRPREMCHIIKLTVEERHLLRQEGQEVLDEYVYCKPCWKVLSDPVNGPSLMKGLAQADLRRLGVSNAEEWATKYFTRLIQLKSHN